MIIRGSENPILALEKISQQLKRLTGAELEFEHVFACESDPHIQASPHTHQTDSHLTADPIISPAGLHNDQL